MHADWVSTLLGSRGIVGYWDTYQAENATCKIASVPLETVPRRRREFARGKVKRAQRWGKKKHHNRNTENNPNFSVPSKKPSRPSEPSKSPGEMESKLGWVRRSWHPSQAPSPEMPTEPTSPQSAGNPSRLRVRADEVKIQQAHQHHAERMHQGAVKEQTSSRVMIKPSVYRCFCAEAASRSPQLPIQGVEEFKSRQPTSPHMELRRTLAMIPRPARAAVSCCVTFN